MSWRKNFEKKMMFSIERKVNNANPYDWIDEIRERIGIIDHLKFTLNQKANHVDLIQFYSQKAGKVRKTILFRGSILQ